jgi:hypothetical protein
MQTTPLSPGAVRYNPQTNAFEALVTIQTLTGTHRYPCSFEGSLKMPLTTAAHKLTQQAKRLHAAKAGLRAHTSALDLTGTVQSCGQCGTAPAPRLA